MATLEAILKAVANLTPSEQTKLVELLQERLRRSLDEDDDALGRRGLAAWTESAANEDWSTYYPNGLLKASGGGTT